MVTCKRINKLNIDINDSKMDDDDDNYLIIAVGSTGIKLQTEVSGRETSDQLKRKVI